MRRLLDRGTKLLMMASLAACTAESSASKQLPATVRLTVDGVETVREGTVGTVIDPFIERTPYALYEPLDDELHPLGPWSPSEIWAHEATALFTGGGGAFPEGLTVEIRNHRAHASASAVIGDYVIEYTIDGARLTATARGRELFALSLEGQVPRDRQQDYFAAVIANTARGSAVIDLVEAPSWNLGGGSFVCAEDDKCPRSIGSVCKEALKKTWKWIVGGGAAAVATKGINKANAVLDDYNACQQKVTDCHNNNNCECTKQECDSLCGDSGERCSAAWNKQKASCSFTPPGGGKPTGKVYFMCNYTCEKTVACSELCTPESISYSPCGCPKDHKNASCSGTDTSGASISSICLGSSQAQNYTCDS